MPKHLTRITIVDDLPESGDFPLGYPVLLDGVVYLNSYGEWLPAANAFEEVVELPDPAGLPDGHAVVFEGALYVLSSGAFVEIGLPPGNEGEYLRRTADGAEFVAISQLPLGGVAGQTVIQTAEGPEWMHVWMVDDEPDVANALYIQDGTLRFRADDGYVTVLAGPHSIADVTPDSGSIIGGTEVVLNGSGFTDATAVEFGGVEGTAFSVVNDAIINVTTPADDAGSVDVVVVRPTTNLTLAGGFTYTEAIASVDPASGSPAGGDAVVIAGTGFTGATAVEFGGTEGTSFSLVDDSTINVTTPAGTAGDVDVTVVRPTTNLVLTGGFSYVDSITDVSPDSGPEAGGDAVVLTGTGFTDATAVEFDGAEGTSFSVVNDTTINVTTPAGTAGAVDVVVVRPTTNITLEDGFTYV